MGILYALLRVSSTLIMLYYIYMSDKAFFFQGDTLLLPQDFPDKFINEGIMLEHVRDFTNYELFEIPPVDNTAKPDEPIKTVSVDTGAALPAFWKAVPVRQVLMLISGGVTESNDSGCILRACHIAQWRRDSVFCGRCGAKNVDSSPGSSGEEVHRLCPKCGRIEFPRICPAIIVVITDDDDRILLAHNKKFREGMYSLIAGFNEAGESLEDTVAREIREEVNIAVKDIQYIRSQPWPFPNSLMLGFRARYLSGTVRPDGVEIEDAKWFDRNSLPELPGCGSLSRHLIDSWLLKTVI
jgi:NAD+ diphosphatase